jgi:WD40 repeat protein
VHHLEQRSPQWTHWREGSGAPVRLAFSVLLALLCISNLGCSDSTSGHPSGEATPWRTHSARSSSELEGQWSPTGHMAQGRLLHTAALLADGRVLSAGGYNRSAELYDPATGTWSRTADTLNTHRAATATVLPNGQVLLVGRGGAEWDSGISSEVYNIGSGTWAPTRNLVTPRLYHTATLLPDGRVLVTGGAGSEYGGAVLATAEVYDATAGTWTATAPMLTPRRNHTATLLQDGRVLVTGGTSASGQPQSSAEVYDSATGTWSPVGTMVAARASHSATLLQDGKVLVAGGGGSDWASSASVELFNPAAGTWTATASLAFPRRSHSATLLSSGRVLVAGGFHEYTGILTSAEVYEPSSGAWLTAGPLATGRYLHTATPLASGRVLVAGGFSNADQASAELYTPPGSSEPQGPPEDPEEPEGTSLLLQVVDSEGNPVAGAAISSQDAVFPLDSSGHLLFEGLAPGRFFARVDAPGFTSATAVVELEAGAHVGTQVKLLPLPEPISFQAQQGATIQTPQVRLSIPPDAVVDALGQPVTGPVDVTIAPLDPTTQLASMPGPLEGTASSDGAAVQLESFFMAEVSLWSNGAQLQLAPGKSATLEFLLPAALASQFKAGDTVPAWWFDLDAGHWREEGSGTIQPSSSEPGRLAWAVQVNHFTWWNCDKPWTDKSCVNVLVVDPAGAPVPGAAVNAKGVSYSGASTPRYTGANGRACVEIKRGGTADVFAGMPGQPATDMLRVTGTQQPAVCGNGSCTEATLVLEDLICTPGSYKQCAYSGPEGTAGQGLCRASRRQCNVIGTAWSACQGEVLPAPENCRTPFDDNCEGRVNEDCICSARQGMSCYGGPTGTQGVGSCRGGTIGCDLFGNVICQGQQLPTVEACWTPADEDCNGVSEACERGPSGWAPTGSMRTPRALPTATRLPNGKVLVTGGVGTPGALAATELYDPASGIWSATGAMASPRYYHTATLLPNGKVLVTGGFATTSLATAVLYDPASGTWSTTGSMISPRYLHAATLLPNGKVLVTGGHSGAALLTTAEVYDPASGTWSAAGAMASRRYLHTATLLPNGKVLVAGGYIISNSLAGAELYDPASGTWSATGAMASPRSYHTATLLPNGKVLVAGGTGSTSLLSTAEVYDPASGTWSATGSIASTRLSHTATLLPNGKVLLAGGDSNGRYLAEAEVYDPASGTWSATASMATPRFRHTATLLPNGKVLIAAGDGNTRFLAAAALYTP